MAASQGGIITRYDRRTGDIARRSTSIRCSSPGCPRESLQERWQWTFPIVFSPVDPKILYTSSQHLWKTTDAGQQLGAISPDLTRNDPKTLGDSGGPITKDQNGPEIYGTIFTIAPSRHDVNTIWTGSDDGLVYITRDGGKTLEQYHAAGHGRFQPHQPDRCVAARSRRGLCRREELSDGRPPALHLQDCTITARRWTKIVNGIPADDFVQAVREDPVRRGAAVTREPSMGFMFRSTTARTGNRSR